MNEIRDKVIQAIYQITRPEKPDLSDQGRPLLGGALDSLDFASLLMAIEDEFDLRITEADVESLSSIDQIVAFVQASASGKS